MKNITPAGCAVRELRWIIGKTQAQFASMIGVSLDTVGSVEIGRNGVSTKLATQIHIATGADAEALLQGSLVESARSRIKRKAGRSVAVPFDYTKKSFEHWRSSNFQTSEANGLARFNGMKGWIKLVFLAAGRPGRAGNKDRLPGVWLSLVEWLEATRETFKLAPEIDAILKEYAGQQETEEGRAKYRWNPHWSAPRL
jgi:DNA-binding XRE family transcriptional regulator